MRKSLSISLLTLILLSTANGQIVSATSVSESDNQQKLDSNFVVTKDNTKEQFQKTIDYLKEQKIEVKQAIPEIGWIETAKTTAQEQNKIEDNTPSIVKEPTKNDTYKTSSLREQDKMFWNEQWNMQKLASKDTKINNGQLNKLTIGIIDSGLNQGYRNMLKDKIRYTENFVPTGGFANQDGDEYGNPNDIEDRKGHGTSVTSLILGTNYMAGIAPDVKVDEYRVFSRKGSNPTWVLKALVKAADNGDDIINMSLGRYGIITGGYGNSNQNDSAEFEAWTRAVEYAKKKGSVVVVAAGNESLNLDNSQEIVDYINKEHPGLNAHGEGKSLPGSIPGIIQVAATGASGKRADFSCYSKDSIYAPGGDTSKTGLENPNINLVPSEWIMTYGGHHDRDYHYSVGTSFSAPEVSGMLAHLVADNNLEKQPDQIKQKLSETLVKDQQGLNNVTLDSILNHSKLSKDQGQPAAA